MNLEFVQFYQKMYLQRCILSLIFLLCSYLQGVAQRASIDDFFQGKLKLIESIFEKNNRTSTFNPSWLEKIGVRTQTNEFEWKRQEYLLRIYPSTGKIRKAQSNLHQALIEHNQLKTNLLKKIFIKNIYDDLLLLFELTKKLEIEKALLVVLQDQEKVLERLTGQSEKNVKDWIEKHRAITELQANIFKYETQLNADFPKQRIKDWSALISPDQIIQHIKKLSPQRVVQNFKQQSVTNKKLLDETLNLEEAERKQWLDFFQIRYRGPHANSFGERVSISTGIELPFFSSRKLKLEELTIEKDWIQKELDVKAKVQQEKFSKQSAQIQLDYKTFLFSNRLSREAKIKNNHLLQKVFGKEGSTPLLLLYQKQLEFENQLDYLKKEVKFYEDYINLLELGGYLYQMPLKNYLVRGNF